VGRAEKTLDALTLKSFGNKKPPLSMSRGLVFHNLVACYFTTLTKIIRNVNRTSDSIKASPTNKAI
jgi:hypothetical protein